MPQTQQTHYPYRRAVLELADDMRKLALEVAAKKPLCFSTFYADGTWRITLHADGAVTNEGYAAETRGSRCNVQDLALFELAGLLAEAQALPA